jgi:hypothetical protein
MRQSGASVAASYPATGNRAGAVIQFERASEPKQRDSRYRIIEVSDRAALRAALARTMSA